jgi:hypothetical protein
LGTSKIFRRCWHKIVARDRALVRPIKQRKIKQPQSTIVTRDSEAPPTTHCGHP